MTPAARFQASIDILDAISDGLVAEQALTRWARSNRFAGSKDRAAIRDHVFDILRKKRSCQVAGGASQGRALVLGYLRLSGIEPGDVFNGQGYAPEPLAEHELSQGSTPTADDMLDLSDWLAERFRASLSENTPQVAAALRERAPVFLRVNLLKTDVAGARLALTAEGIDTELCQTSPTSLRVLNNERRVSLGATYQDGLIEMQDAASQAVVDLMPLKPGLRVLDYCAGGGGKALAVAAALDGGAVEIHDIDPRRMKDATVRAERAGAVLRPVSAPEGAYDLVLCDVPCSGSGSWRRAPEAKWAFTPERLAELQGIQSEILTTCTELVTPGGYLAYVTCSCLDEENAVILDRFSQNHSGWTETIRQYFSPGTDGDGMFVAVFQKS